MGRECLSHQSLKPLGPPRLSSPRPCAGDIERQILYDGWRFDTKGRLFSSVLGLKAGGGRGREEASGTRVVFE